MTSIPELPKTHTVAQVFSPTGFINSTREQTTETLRLKTMSTKNYSMNSVHKVGTKSETAKCSPQIENTFLIRVINEPLLLRMFLLSSFVHCYFLSKRTYNSTSKFLREFVKEFIR